MMAIFIGSIAIVALLLAGILLEFTFVSEGVQGIIAIVVLWYTWETAQIRKAEREIAEVSKASLLKSYRPAVGHSVYINEKLPYDPLSTPLFIVFSYLVLQYLRKDTSILVEALNFIV